MLQHGVDLRTVYPRVGGYGKFVSAPVLGVVGFGVAGSQAAGGTRDDQPAVFADEVQIERVNAVAEGAGGGHDAGWVDAGDAEDVGTAGQFSDYDKQLVGVSCLSICLSAPGCVGKPECISISDGKSKRNSVPM